MIIVAEDPYWKPVEWKESTKRDSSWASKKLQSTGFPLNLENLET